MSLLHNPLLLSLYYTWFGAIVLQHLVFMKLWKGAEQALLGLAEAWEERGLPLISVWWSAPLMVLLWPIVLIAIGCYRKRK